jgi:hypothetical protein
VKEDGMDSQDPNQTSQGQSPSVTLPDERAVLVRFLESLRADKSFEAERQFIRVVPRGLFVDERGVGAVVERYQSWILAESKGVAHKSIEKCHLWLFESHTPERFYLTEGKNVLAGFLIPLPLKNPQQFNLPYYLGSLLSTTNYIHPADPQLQGLKGVEFRTGQKGLEILIARRKAQVVLSESVLRHFFEVAGHSRFLQRRYPGIETNLSVCLKALLGIARRARDIPRTFPMVVPFQTKTSKTTQVRLAGKFLFIEDKGTIFRILELNGRNLSTLLRHELNNAPRDKLGSFRLTPKHRDLIGFYDIGGKRTSVHARAFSEFSELIRRTREPREKMSGWFTSVECFEKFSFLFQTAQPIEKHKIAGALSRFGVTDERFRINGGWIFVLSKEGTVMRTVAKHIRLVGHQRGG